MTDCYNCGAPNAQGIDWDGRHVCCATCVFHPLGCRCKYGKPLNTPETMDYALDEEMQSTSTEEGER